MTERKRLYNQPWLQYTQMAIEEGLVETPGDIALHQLEMLAAIADEIHALGDALKQLANSAVYPPLEE